MKNGKWKIEYFNAISSTQKYLLDRIEKEDLNNYCIWSENQTDGIGTKNRKWKGKSGNIFLSFCVSLKEYDFVPMQSLSVYFSFLLYDVLVRYKDNLIIKWPNDIYLIEESPKKVAGILTNVKKGKIICGIGINTKYAPEIQGEYKAGCLDIKIKNDKIVKEILEAVSDKKSWKKVFLEYKKIFEKSKKIFEIKNDLNYDATLKR